MLRLAVTSAAAFLLAHAVVYHICAPFAVAFLSARRRRDRLIAAAVGAVVGYCTLRPADSGIRYLAASAIVVAAKLLLGASADKLRFFAPCLAVGSVTLTTFAAALVDPTAEPGMVFVAELLLVGAASVLFAKAVSRGAEDRRAIAVCCSAALCAMAIPSVGEGEWCFFPGRLAACAAVVAASASGGVYGGVTAGIITGLAADLTGGGIPICTAAYAAAGLAAGLSRNRLRPVLFGAVCAAVAVLVPGLEHRFGFLLESLAAIVLLPLLPQRLFPGSRPVPAEPPADREARLRRHVQTRLYGLATAYDEVAQTVAGEPDAGETHDEAESFAAACEAVCSRCEHWPLCSREIASDKAGVHRVLNAGLAVPEDLCTSVRSRCAHQDALCACITMALRAGRERRLRGGEWRENRALLSKQYSQISALLDAEASSISEDLRFEQSMSEAVQAAAERFGVHGETAVYRDRSGRIHAELCARDLRPLAGQLDALTALMGEVTGVAFGMPEQIDGRSVSCLSFTEEEDRFCRIGAAAEKKRGQTVSGDCGTYFCGRDGRTCVVLCDGMGSGKEAHAEAARTVRLLESFLRAGVEPSAAAEIIRSAVHIRSGSEAFATMDISVIDPAAGELCTVKYRAAPTYLRREDANGYHVELIGGESEQDPEAVTAHRVKLAEGDMIVLVSDGMTASGGRGEVTAGLERLHCDDPRELAGLLLRTVKGDGSRDDRTVIALSCVRKAVRR